ncbi:uncharacterized protein ACB058_021512 [Synchiropus picturatus]
MPGNTFFQQHLKPHLSAFEIGPEGERNNPKNNPAIMNQSGEKMEFELQKLMPPPSSHPQDLDNPGSEEEEAPKKRDKGKRPASATAWDNLSSSRSPHPSALRRFYCREALLSVLRTIPSDLSSTVSEVLRGYGLLQRPHLAQHRSTTSFPVTHWKRHGRNVRKQKRGKRGGHRARLAASPLRPAIPTITMANVRSLANKLDDIRLLRNTFRSVRDCCAFVFVETWLNDTVPDHAIELARTQLTAHPDALLILAGDFNHADPKSVLPQLHSHVNFATRGNNTLDNVYTAHRGAYRSVPLPPLGASDHTTVLLIPAYRPRVKITKPTKKRIRVWPEGSSLNDFFARFEAVNKTPAQKLPLTPEDQVLSLSPNRVRRSLRRIDVRKASGPDDIPGRVLKDCAGELTDVLTDIFNTSLSQAVVPTCLKAASIIPVPKKTSPTCHNDYRPVALTPIIMKCFERLVMHHIKTSLPPALDPYQFAYRSNRSTDDAISTALHSVLTHLETRDSCARMLFLDFSSAFNTIIPQQLILKLVQLGLDRPLCNWLLDFLTGRPQFADDTTVVGLIRNDDESNYRSEVSRLVQWCDDNNLRLNVEKTKEMVVDFRRRPVLHRPLLIAGATVEQVTSTKFLGVHISQDLTWNTNTTALAKKAQQRLYFLRKLKRAGVPSPIMCTFYRGTIESVLTSCITVWFVSCTIACRKTLQRVVKTAEKIIGVPLPSLLDIYQTRLTRRALRIAGDPTHPSHRLFTLLPSGRRFQSHRARTSRLRDSFIHQAVMMLNSLPALPPGLHQALLAPSTGAEDVAMLP